MRFVGNSIVMIRDTYRHSFQAICPRLKIIIKIIMDQKSTFKQCETCNKCHHVIHCSVIIKCLRYAIKASGQAARRLVALMKLIYLMSFSSVRFRSISNGFYQWSPQSFSKQLRKYNSTIHFDFIYSLNQIVMNNRPQWHK